jgi:hypothetical protein
MPVTITPAPTLDKLGPGLFVHAHSDFGGTIGSNWRWVFTYSTDDTPAIGNQVSSISVPSFGLADVDYVLYLETTGIRVKDTDVDSGTTVYLTVDLVNGVAAVQDTGQINRAWDSTSGLGFLMQQVYASRATSTFTPTDRTNMANGFTNTIDALTTTLTTAAGDVTQTVGELFSKKTLDALTLAEITSGPTGSQVHSLVTFGWYGVIVRITTIPSNLQPITPDADWYIPDLAVLRVFRGSDLEYRRGIHSSTWMAPSPWKTGLEAFNLLSIFGSDVPDTNIYVDFRSGVEGQVFLMAWP